MVWLLRAAERFRTLRRAVNSPACAVADAIHVAMARRAARKLARVVSNQVLLSFDVIRTANASHPAKLALLLLIRLLNMIRW